MDAIVLEATPPDREYWTGPEQDAVTLTTEEVAKFVFAASREWLYLILRRYPDAVTPPTVPGSRRVWVLWDVERLAHSLCELGALEPYRTRQALLVVAALARAYRMTEE